jgi:hypothetical protein
MIRTRSKRSRTLKKDPLVKATSSPKVDPLYVIFEQHLFGFADPNEDRRKFIATVVEDYLCFLRKNNIIVPVQLQQAICEELGAQVNTMLVKKIYGCLNVNDYVEKIPTSVKKQSQKTYKKLTEKASKKSA